VAGMVV